MVLEQLNNRIQKKLKRKKRFLFNNIQINWMWIIKHNAKTIKFSSRKQTHLHELGVGNAFLDITLKCPKPEKSWYIDL